MGAELTGGRGSWERGVSFDVDWGEGLWGGYLEETWDLVGRTVGRMPAGSVGTRFVVELGSIRRIVRSADDPCPNCTSEDGR